METLTEVAPGGTKCANVVLIDVKCPNVELRSDKSLDVDLKRS